MRYIELPIEKGVVFLTIEEIEVLIKRDRKIAALLLKQNIEIFKRGLKRGKYIMRSNKQKDREKNK